MDRFKCMGAEFDLIRDTGLHCDCLKRDTESQLECLFCEMSDGFIRFTGIFDFVEYTKASKSLPRNVLFCFEDIYNVTK